MLMSFLKVRMCLYTYTSSSKMERNLSDDICYELAFICIEKFINYTRRCVLKRSSGSFHQGFLMK